MNLWEAFKNLAEHGTSDRDIQHGSKKASCGNCGKPIHDHTKHVVDGSGGTIQYGYYCDDGRRIDI